MRRSETRIDLKHREFPWSRILRPTAKSRGRRLAGLQATGEGGEKDNIALTLIRKLETSALIESLRNNLANAKADGIAALKLERDLMEFKSKLDEIEDAVEWPALTAETKRWLDDIEKLLSQFGSPEDRTKAQGFRRQIGEVISLKKTQRLRSKLKEVRAFYYQLLLEQPDFWIGYFNNLAKQTSQMRDRTVADRLIKQGRECVTANNIQGLKNAVGGLQDLLAQGGCRIAQEGLVWHCDMIEEPILQPDTERSLGALGSALTYARSIDLANRGRFADAELLLGAAGKLPEDAASIELLANLQMRQGKLEMARGSWKRVLVLRPGYSRAIKMMIAAIDDWSARPPWAPLAIWGALAVAGLAIVAVFFSLTAEPKHAVPAAPPVRAVSAPEPVPPAPVQPAEAPPTIHFKH